MKHWLVALLILLPGLVTQADDVTDWIEDGLAAYKAGNRQEAIQSLDYASQLIRQLKGEQLETLFPEAPAGWKKEDSNSQSVATAYMGGGTSAGASYRRIDDSGDSIDISITTDNPMIGMLSAAFASPMMMSASGQKLIKLKGHKATLEYEASSREGDINLLIGGKVLVNISGYGVSEEELRDFASRVDFDAIEAAAGE